MEIEEIMVDFFEGETTLDLEMKMFREMASDEYLIASFKNFMFIENAMKASIDSFSSPPGVTNTIFKKLGYSFPSEFKTKRSIFFFLKNNRTLSHVISAIFASAVTIALIFLFFNPESKNNIISAKHNTTDVVTGSNSTLPFISSKENAVNHPVKQTYMQHTSALNNTEENQNVVHSILTQTNEDQLLLSSIAPPSDNKIAEDAAAITVLQTSDILLNQSYPVYIRNLIDLSFGFTGLAMWEIPKAAIPIKNISPFNNNAVSIYYDLSENIKIGAELRQENFYTEYTGIESNDSLFLYQQQSNLTSISANARFFFWGNGYLCPYLGTNIGINNGGYLLRLNPGLEYRIYRDIALMLGFEFTYFRFTHQDKWYGASKAGINYGLLIKF